jgi:hypothetical protein
MYKMYDKTVEEIAGNIFKYKLGLFCESYYHGHS